MALGSFSNNGMNIISSQHTAKEFGWLKKDAMPAMTVKTLSNSSVCCGGKMFHVNGRGSKSKSNCIHISSRFHERGLLTNYTCNLSKN
ncbi:hypothetical protein NC653_030757 [Populus alba x Populus x berolinensis]|uniref:Uncharacterized protein n=1 Tax=Populus alba x Populus x berolinensis TaxID=444605 RepID=A0AAD6Q0K4_9ROSI|nr:hypothetical protein NC653_030757 [Populus alba x Populus x berolinensis]